MTSERLQIIIDAQFKGKRDIEAAGRELKLLDSNARRASEGTRYMREQMARQLAQVGLAFGAVALAAKAGYDALKEGAALDLAAQQFDNLAVSIGTTSDALINKLGRATGGMVSNAEMIASASQMISLGLGKNEDEVVRLSTVVSTLGLDMQQVILTFANNSVMRLDALGLSVDGVKQKAQELEAQGFVGDAFDEAVLIALEEKMTLLGDASETSAGKLKIFEASVKNVTDAGKLWLVDVLTPSIDAMNTLMEVNQRGGETIDDIVKSNIAQATSVDDLVTQYQRIQKQAGMWGGLAAAMTGTQDDLYNSGLDVHEALLRMASGADEYIEAAKAMQIVGTNQGQMSEDQARLYYEEAIAALAVADAMKEQADYAAMYLDYQKALYATTEESATATSAYGWSLDGVRKNYEGLYQSGFGKFADDLGEIDEAARAAGEAFNNYFVGALEDGESIYGKWVTTATAMGGRTEEQEENFQELSTAAERLRDNIQSLQGGTAGLGLTQDQLNEKLAEQYEQLALVEGAMGPLAGITTTYSDAQQRWVVDGEAMNEELYSQIAAMSDNAYETAGAAYALGLYDEAQLATALNAAIIKEKIQDLAQAFNDGEISAGQLKEEMENIIAGSPYVTEIDVLTDEAIGNVDKLKSKLDAMDGRTITSKISVVTEYKGGPPPGGGGASGGAPGGQTGSGGGNPAPGAYATGGVVPGPMGAPQLAIVHGGEEVPTPAQRAQRGGGITISFSGAIFQGTSQQMAFQMVTMVAEQLGRL